MHVPYCMELNPQTTKNQPEYGFITESGSSRCCIGKSKQTKKKKQQALKTDKAMTDHLGERTHISTDFRQITKQSAHSKLWKVTRKLPLKYSCTTCSFWQSQYKILLIYSQEFKPWTLAWSKVQREEQRSQRDTRGPTRFRSSSSPSAI